MEPQSVNDQDGRRDHPPVGGRTDYSGDLNIDDKILARVVDTYRRVRNTLKFLLANVSDFDPAKDAVPADQLLEIDRYALSRLAQLQTDILAHYDVYEFHPVVASCRCIAAKTWAPSTSTC